jgi:hypothetical protein
MKRLTNPKLPGVVHEAPDSAVPILANSGWVEMSKKDAEALEQQTVEQARATDAQMAEAAAATLPPEQQPEQTDTDEPAPRKSSSKKENS